MNSQEYVSIEWNSTVLCGPVCWENRQSTPHKIAKGTSEYLLVASSQITGRLIWSLWCTDVRYYGCLVECG